MKSKLTTLDIVVLIQELRTKLLGLRVDQVYDLDKKSYLIRLTKTDMKKMLLIDSGCRFHTTTFEWPKNPAPSGFTMKLRKHLSNKRLENISQLGADRVVDFQFGQEAFTFHIILELYDKGNIILTDQHYNILSVVRPHVLGEDRIAAHEKYAVDKVKTNFSLPVPEIGIQLKENPSKSLREIFLSKIEFGPALLSFVLKEQGLTPATKIPSEDDAEAFRVFEEKLIAALERGRLILEQGDVLGGFILTNPASSKPRPQLKSKEGSEPSEPLLIYDQFHPLILAPNFPENQIINFPTFDEAVDDFFSKVESQKLDLKQVNQERDALNKLERVKADQRKRMDELKLVQEVDKKKAELIMFNQEVIEKTIAIIRQLIANQLSWDDIWEQIKEAQQKGDPLASKITALNLIKNRFSMHLKDPYETEEDKPAVVEIDLDLSAYSNATKYFDLKKASAKKEERTFESQEKALKSTEKKTMTSLREVAAIQLIKKARKVFWFEKFRWFISSENYLVLGGQDAQQNELLVKRYMKPKDIYLHADSHGAPTIVIKNDGAPNPVLPKTLNEAGTMAVCASGAWETKIVPSAWWVWGEQVSKSAPTGEYLPTGSFMIRGKKNFLPPSQLVLGFGFLFRLSDESMARHVNERARRVHTSSFGESVLDLERKMSLEEDKMNSSEGEEDENQFPDTKLELDEDTFRRQRTLSALSSGSIGSSLATQEEGQQESEKISFITSGTLKTISLDVSKIQKDKRKAMKNKKAGGAQGPMKPEPVIEPEQPSETATNKPKRGQHGRKKKLKEKYKFQDDEERELRMQLLQAKPPSKSDTPVAPPAPPTQPSIPEGDEETEEAEKKPETEVKLPKEKYNKPVPVNFEPDAQDAAEPAEVETNFLNSLTGSPLEEDELMFAIPVIAPYSTLQNYKFRIKMLPGSSKRGKAARNAVEMFLRDKQARPREKDLLKSVKDQDLARNFPGKVKLAGGSDKK